MSEENNPSAGVTLQKKSPQHLQIPFILWDTFLRQIAKGNLPIKTAINDALPLKTLSIKYLVIQMDRIAYGNSDSHGFFDLSTGTS